MLSGLPLMRQVVGFLNCLKKNGLSNEKYVPRKRPRDFSRAGTLVVDMAAEQGQDRLPRRGGSGMPPAVRRKGAYFVLRSPHSQARLTITPVARYTRTAASLPSGSISMVATSISLLRTGR